MQSTNLLPQNDDATQEDTGAEKYDETADAEHRDICKEEARTYTAKQRQNYSVFQLTQERRNSPFSYNRSTLVQRKDSTKVFQVCSTYLETHSNYVIESLVHLLRLRIRLAVPLNEQNQVFNTCIKVRFPSL